MITPAQRRGMPRSFPSTVESVTPDLEWIASSPGSGNPSRSILPGIHRTRCPYLLVTVLNVLQDHENFGCHSAVLVGSRWRHGRGLGRLRPASSPPVLHDSVDFLGVVGLARALRWSFASATDTIHRDSWTHRPSRVYGSLERTICTVTTIAFASRTSVTGAGVGTQGSITSTATAARRAGAQHQGMQDRRGARALDLPRGLRRGVLWVSVPYGCQHGRFHAFRRLNGHLWHQTRYRDATRRIGSPAASGQRSTWGWIPAGSSASPAKGSPECGLDVLATPRHSFTAPNPDASKRPSSPTTAVDTLPSS